MDCSKIQTNLKKIKAKLNSTCELIVVSKYRELQEIECAYASGHRKFAENRVQALLERKENLPKDIEWHLIGHLQGNKAKYIAPFIHTVHSVDSEKILVALNKEAKKRNRIINCLLQIHIAQEKSKFGFSIEGLHQLLDTFGWKELTSIRITGLMAMATNTKDNNIIEQEFKLSQSTFQAIKAKHFKDNDLFKELSIGMSSDFEIALNTGSTMLRIGSGVFN